MSREILYNIKREKMKKVLLLLFAAAILSGIASAQEADPKFSGLMFGDYFYNIDSHDSTLKDLNGFRFRRIYITTDYTISNRFDTRFRLEADQSRRFSNCRRKNRSDGKGCMVQMEKHFRGI